MGDQHAAARAMYQEYVARAAVLERNRAFADKVMKATAGEGQTPVEPLATMGKNGGPLLCDVCGKAMILEGGRFQGVFAHDAWRRNPTKGWTSWISGGMVVRIETNRTLRIYHGYPGRSGCVVKADRADDKLRAQFEENNKSADISAKLAAMRLFLKAEHPEQANDAVMTEIYRVMLVYDPGLGVNAVD